MTSYLADGGSPSITDRYDCEPIYTAVKYDRLEIAEMLLAAGGSIDRRSKFRGDPFDAACCNWNIRMIEFCISAGVDINTVHRRQTILDSLANQSVPDTALPRWQAAYDRLVELGAKRSSELDA